MTQQTNNILGKFQLPPGVSQIDVAFDIGTNGILNVSAAEKINWEVVGKLSIYDTTKFTTKLEKFKLKSKRSEK